MERLSIALADDALEDEAPAEDLDAIKKQLAELQAKLSKLK